MPRYLLIALVSLLIANAASAQDASSAFIYQPDRVPVGTVYHYTKSNLDGSHAAELYVFVAPATDLEVLKLEPESTTAAYVRADMDWTAFAAARLDAWHLTETGLTPQLYLDFDHAADTATAYMGPMAMPVSFEALPVHLYNFDLMSLNAALPHLHAPEADFAVGIVDPNWTLFAGEKVDPQPVLENGLLYKGKAHFTYQGQDSHRGLTCHTYRVDGPGLDDQEGMLWVSAEDGHIVLFEHPTPDNPAWDTFKLEWKETLRMNGGAWRGFMMQMQRQHAAAGQAQQ